MKFRSIALLVVIAGLALAFLVLDSGLSGGSASSPIFPIAIAVGCGVLIIFIALGNESTARGVSLLPLVLLLAGLGFCAKRYYEWEYRPEAVAIRAQQSDLRCVLGKLGINTSDSLYIRVRLNMMESGAISARLNRREIEDYLGIQTYGDCQYDVIRSGGGRLPPPGTPFPNITLPKSAREIGTN